MLDQDIDTTNYGTFEYSTSNVKKVVDNWLNIYMKDYKYLIDGTYDLSSYDTYDSTSLINLYGYSTMNVGILTVREAELITKGVESKDNFHVIGDAEKVGNLKDVIWTAYDLANTL